MTAPIPDGKLRVAVVGAGVMGANHVRVVSQYNDADLVAVVDTDNEKAEAAARGVRTFESIEDCLPNLDAVVIATPTNHHFDLAMRVIASGKHVLVEKPISSTIEEGAEMVAAATNANVVLAVGHVERCNPAVRALANWTARPIHIQVERTNPFTPRIQDGVIRDLMIHDLDVVSVLADDCELVSVSGVAQQVRNNIEELAVATLGFSNGVTASLTASRLGQHKVREIQVCERDRLLRANLLRQDLEIDRLTQSEYLADDGVRYRQSSVSEVPFIENRREPLVTQFELFVSAIRSHGKPAATGADGLRALKLVLQVEQAVRRFAN